MTPPIVELRQYSLLPGCRSRLVDMFDTHFVDAQEAVGIRVIGQFLDLDDPNRFVWLRGFPSMSARVRGLRSFYEGPVWRQYRERANATMLDSDNVLLLRPVGRRTVLDGPADEWRAEQESLLGVLVAHLGRPPSPADIGTADDVADAFASKGAQVLGVYASHPEVNNFPALPIREDPVLVWITRHSSPASHARDVGAITQQRGSWRLPAAAGCPPQVLRLFPTPRSTLQ